MSFQDLLDAHEILEMKDYVQAQELKQMRRKNGAR